MKTTPWFLLAPLLIFSGCASQSITKSETPAANHQQHADSKPLCPEQSRPGLSCAETVTATFDAEDRLWIAWVNHDHIYVQSSADKGNSFTPAVVVNPVAEPVGAHGEYRPKIQLDKQGNIYLTWTESLEKRHTGHIRFTRSTDGGNSFAPPVTINDNPDIISHRFDSLQVGQNGEIFIAWLDARDKERAKAGNGQEFLGTSLYYTWSDNGGRQFYPNKQVAPHTCECCRLGTALDRQNLPVVVWRHVYPGNIRDHAAVKFQDWQTPGDINRVAADDWKIEACPHHGPALSIADDDSYHVTWFSGAEQHKGLFYANSKDHGKTYSSPMPFGGQGASHPDVASLGQQVAIVWTEFDGQQTRVQLIQSDDGGINWSQPKSIASSTSPADYAFLISDHDQLYLSWQTREAYHIKPLAEF